MTHATLPDYVAHANFDKPEPRSQFGISVGNFRDMLRKRAFQGLQGREAPPGVAQRAAPLADDEVLIRFANDKIDLRGTASNFREYERKWHVPYVRIQIATTTPRECSCKFYANLGSCAHIEAVEIQRAEPQRNMPVRRRAAAPPQDGAVTRRRAKRQANEATQEKAKPTQEKGKPAKRPRRAKEAQW